MDEAARAGVEGRRREFDVPHPAVSAEVSTLGTRPAAQLFEARGSERSEPGIEAMGTGVKCLGKEALQIGNRQSGKHS